MTAISFQSANYVARQLKYRITRGWEQGERATNAYFKPINTFRIRFEELLTEIRSLGFDHLDLWLAHLNPKWATPEHVAIARELLETYRLPVVSLAGGMGDTLEEFKAICELARALNCPILGGITPLLVKDRGALIPILKDNDLKLAHENHPEKTPQEILEKIGDGAGGTFGVAVDTGWFGTHGYDAARAIRELGKFVFHIHLKDVRRAGAHDSCRYGEGVVPIRQCVKALQEIGYRGAITVEHEPENFNPNDDVIASRKMLESWLK